MYSYRIGFAETGYEKNIFQLEIVYRKILHSASDYLCLANASVKHSFAKDNSPRYILSSIIILKSNIVFQ